MARRLHPSAAYGSGIPRVTLRIEKAYDGQTAMLRVIGRLQSECLEELRAQVRKHHPRLVLDLDEVTLVDAGVVRFLNACEAEGIELRHCAPYIREWMRRERGIHDGSRDTGKGDRDGAEK